jgi:N-acyl-D-aspartate/D-glutamate deacylase
MFDCLITGGALVDGTGAPRRQADLAIRDGRIVGIGRFDEPAARKIDASGRVVAPGFVDIHTHFDAQVFWDGTLSPSPLHGVTSVAAGNCGFSIAPLSPEAGDYLKRTWTPGFPGTGPPSPSTWLGSRERSPSTRASWWVTRRCGVW